MCVFICEQVMLFGDGFVLFCFLWGVFVVFQEGEGFFVWCYQIGVSVGFDGYVVEGYVFFYVQCIDGIVVVFENVIGFVVDIDFCDYCEDDVFG